MNIPSPLSSESLKRIFKSNPSTPDRINTRESSTVEFKETYNHSSMAAYFKTIAAFANNSGGYLVFGIGDSPRSLLGLNEKSLKQFEDLRVEDFSKNLLDYFSSEIRWDHITFEFEHKQYGIIYVFPASRKPCICKKNHDEKNTKYSLKEGDIYYRYGGRSEKIRYTELQAIIDNTRKSEEQMWMQLIKNIAKIGVENAALLDLDAGKITGQGGTILIDEELISKVAFIKEGEFVETEGKPTLRLIGDVTKLDTGKVIVKEHTQKIPKAIEPGDIVKSFLLGEKVSTPEEYIKVICSSNTANYPIYFSFRSSNIQAEDAISIAEGITSRGTAKKSLIKRLQGKRIEMKPLPKTQNTSAKEKANYAEAWIREEISTNFRGNSLNYCIDALLSLDADQIKKHEKYIRAILLKIFNEYFENSNQNVASNMRKVICRIDEAIHAPPI